MTVETTDEQAKKPGLPPSRSAIDNELKAILVDVLGLEAEDVDQFDMLIEDDDVDAEMLETYGGLLAFVEMKLIEG